MPQSNKGKFQKIKRLLTVSLLLTIFCTEVSFAVTFSLRTIDFPNFVKALSFFLPLPYKDLFLKIAEANQERRKENSSIRMGGQQSLSYQRLLTGGSGGSFQFSSSSSKISSKISLKEGNFRPFLYVGNNQNSNPQVYIDSQRNSSKENYSQFPPFSSDVRPMRVISQGLKTREERKGTHSYRGLDFSTQHSVLRETDFRTSDERINVPPSRPQKDSRSVKRQGVNEPFAISSNETIHLEKQGLLPKTRPKIISRNVLPVESIEKENFLSSEKSKEFLEIQEEDLFQERTSENSTQEIVVTSLREQTLLDSTDHFKSSEEEILVYSPQKQSSVQERPSQEGSRLAEAISDRPRLFLSSPQKSRPKKNVIRSPQKNSRAFSSSTSTLEQSRDGVPNRVPLMPARLFPSSSNNSRAAKTSLEIIGKTLQEVGIQFSPKSEIVNSLQQIAKDFQMGTSEIPKLIYKLAQRIRERIQQIYHVTPEQFEKHIIDLVQPQHLVQTKVDYGSGFAGLAKIVLEVLRARFLTDYLENGKEDDQTKPLLTKEELKPFVAKVVRDLYEQVNPGIDARIRERAKITIMPSVKKISSEKTPFSSEEKNEILEHVFKLFVLDSSFEIPLLTNARGNPDIDSDQLKNLIRPYIVLAVKHLYGSERAEDLILEEIEPEVVSLKADILEEEKISAEEVIHYFDRWLSSRLRALLPGKTEVEKIEFLLETNSRAKELKRIQEEIKKCQDEATRACLKQQEKNLENNALSIILKTLLRELGSQVFGGMPLNAYPVLYEEVKRRIESYLSVDHGFVKSIIRTEKSLAQSILDVKTVQELHTIIKNTVSKRKYIVQIRQGQKDHFEETSPLTVPEFVFLFSLHYWPILQERLAHEKEVKWQEQEKMQLKKTKRAEKFNIAFFEGKIQNLTQPFDALFKAEQIKKPQNVSPNHSQVVVSRATQGPLPPPPPPLSSQKSTTSHLRELILKETKEFQKLLRDLGLVLKETSLTLELLVRIKRQDGKRPACDIVRAFYEKFSIIFHQILAVKNESDAHKMFASQLGVKEAGPLAQALIKELYEELRVYFLESLTTGENIESILTSGRQNPESLKKFNAKIVTITRIALKNHFQAALEKFNLETERLNTDFEILEGFLKEMMSFSFIKYSEEERLEMALGTFVHIFEALKHDPNFKFPRRVSEKNKQQFMLDIEAFKPTCVVFLNKVIAEKFSGGHPYIQGPEYEEEIDDSSEIFPYLGNFFTVKALEFLPGETQEEKINTLIRFTLQQVNLLIEQTLISVQSTKYCYKEGAEINFTEPKLRILQQMISHRYKGFSDYLGNNYRNVILQSDTPVNLISLLIGRLSEQPTRKHIIRMPNPNNKREQIDTPLQISRFDIFLSLPDLWRRKREIEERKIREEEERRKKEEEKKLRIARLTKFIGLDEESFE